MSFINSFDQCTSDGIPYFDGTIITTSDEMRTIMRISDTVYPGFMSGIGTYCGSVALEGLYIKYSNSFMISSCLKMKKLKRQRNVIPAKRKSPLG